MEEYFLVLQKSPLFEGIATKDLEHMLVCLEARKREYPRGSFIASAGENLKEIGIVLTGEVCIIKEDFWGNCNILSKISQGHLFGETYACMPGQALEVSILAQSDASILFLNVEKVLRTCSSACVHHAGLVQNLTQVLASKNRMLTRKIQHVGQRSTREKVLSYLSEQAEEKQAKEFLIPYSRQELADYLCVDRSALSSVLSALKKEGILEFTKNRFVLKR